MSNAEEALPMYEAANVPILGTYKQYSAKNTNAGMDWSYIMLSHDLVLYYAKQDLVGFVINDKAFCNVSYAKVRAPQGVQRAIEIHQMRVIASKYDIELEDTYDMNLALKYWKVTSNGTRYYYTTIASQRIPYLLKQALEKGELTSKMIEDIKTASQDQFI